MMLANLKLSDVKSSTTVHNTNPPCTQPTSRRTNQPNIHVKKKPRTGNHKLKSSPEKKYNCSELSMDFKIKAVETTKGSVFKVLGEREGKRIRIYSYITNFVPIVFGKVEVNRIITQKKFYKVPEEESGSPRKAVRKKGKSMLNKKSKPFPDYLKDVQVNEGLENGELIKGFIRINPNAKECYVSNLDKSLQDYIVPTTEDRNRALDGDEVILRLKPKSEWKDGKTTATVVYISRKIHSRLAVGFLKLMPDKNKTFALFTPRDGRIPRIRISSVSWPQNFYKNSNQYAETLFLAKITEWNDVRFALGTIIEKLGQSGELKAETAAILKELELDVTPYGPEMNRFLKFPPINTEEMKTREDWRNECIFTIDPATARDLDDALSCEELKNGNFKIGVHISDVAFFLDKGTELDEIVRQKATTIYLVDSTYHMLPLEMCLNCSLLPGTEKRAFSVIWEITPDGDIVSTHFARTLVRSCAKLSYDQAQEMIESPLSATIHDPPDIFFDYKITDLSKRINRLQSIAKILRKKRFDNGALRLDQPKLTFDLDASSGEPSDWKVYELKDAHRMIEEFMLLANMSVAEQLVKEFPDLAFLRCHEAPKESMLNAVREGLEQAGIFIDISSAGGLQASLEKYSSDDFLARCRLAVLSHLLTKPMKRAVYFCAGVVEDEQCYVHYALNVPLYTHFTSPIRRYADVMVHRLLAASLGYTERPDWELGYVEEVAQNCNRQKYAAKKAGDASIELYLAHYVEKNQPFVQNAVVVNVREKYFEALVMSCGIALRIFVNDFDSKMKYKVIPADGSTDSDKTEKPDWWKMEVTFPAMDIYMSETTIVIERFTVVKLALERKEKTNKLTGRLVRPLASISFGKSIPEIGTQTMADTLL